MPGESSTAFAPLAGTVVLELAGRSELSACGGLLASLGATVFVVEIDGNRPSRSRDIAGKHPILAAHAALIEALAERCDVLLTSSDWQHGPTPARADHVVRCDITAYGSTGPLCGIPHDESLVQAASGVADTTGLPGGAPTLSGAPYVGMETAVYAASAILAALRHRDEFGHGQDIDMALYDVAVNALLTFLPLVFTGRPAHRAGNRHPTLAPWNTYRARDGWVLICAPTNDQWRRLCYVMGWPDLATHADFDSTTQRFENIEALDRTIGTWVEGVTMDQCVDAVGAAGIPCGPIHTLSSLFQDDNLRHRETLVPSTDGSILCRNPIRASGFDLPPVGAVLPPDGGRGYAEALLAGSRLAKTAPLAREPEVTTSALAGLRVLEIGMNTVAPLACRQLGALGADVVKVEPPAGDSNRVNMPLRDDGQSYVFALSNTDKRGIILDLRNADDAERLWQLIDRCDVVIENLKPGSLARLGFGAQDVRRRRPELIYCSVSGFGQDSAWPGRPALDTVIQALSGAMAVTPVDGVPTKTGISIADQLGGQFGLLGMLAGVRHRLITGTGVTLDIAMQDCTVWATQRAWDAQPASAVILPCTDGWIAAERAIDVAELTKRAALDRCSVQGIAAMPVRSVSEVVDDPQTSSRGLIIDVPTPDGSSWTVLGSPIRLQSTPPVVRKAMASLNWSDPSLIGTDGTLWQAGRP